MALNVSSTVDKLSIISSPTLLQEIFKINAPDLAITWTPLFSISATERARMLDQHLRKLNDTNITQNDNVYRVLSAIFNVSSDSENASFMIKNIESIGLQDKFALYNFELNTNAITPANIAAWVYVKSHDSDTTIPEEKRKKLLDFWRRILLISDNVEKSHDSCTFDISEQTTTKEESLSGLQVFMDHYADKSKELMGIKDFPIRPSIAMHGSFIRYTFTTPQYPHDTTQTEGQNFYIGRDPNATGFLVDYYFARNFLKVTRVTDNTVTRKIAKSFAKHVLGAEVIDKRRMHYPLTIFRTQGYKEKLRLPLEREMMFDRVWVSAIDCAYMAGEDQQPETYCVHDFEGDDILENIEKHFPINQYPINLREIREVTLSFSLSRLNVQANRNKKTKVPRNTYHIDIKPTGKNPHSQIRQIQEEHRHIIMQILETCGLTGKTLDELGDDE